MRPRWLGWLAYIVLASLILVTSCQAWAGDTEAPPRVAMAD